MADESIQLNPRVLEEWQKDRVWIKFMNMQTKSDHTFTVNGITFHLKHNGIHRVPRAVVEALNDAVETIWVLPDESITKMPEKHLEPRMYAEIISEDRAMQLLGDKKDSVIQEIIGDQLGVSKKLSKIEDTFIGDIVEQTDEASIAE